MKELRQVSHPIHQQWWDKVDEDTSIVFEELYDDGKNLEISIVTRYEVGSVSLSMTQIDQFIAILQEYRSHA